MDRTEIMDRIEQSGFVPVAVIDTADKAVPLARAMLAGGVDVVEVTFRTEAAADSIRAISASCGEMLVGAGTVITVEQCELAVASGARFIVSPGFSRDVVEWCVSREIPIVPGCVTPSEIMAAMEYGIRVVKFFPANLCGGLAGMKALSGPFPGIRFIPTSGINGDNAGEFLRASCVFAVGGSWACSKADIAAGNFDRITALCAAARGGVILFPVRLSPVRVTDRHGEIAVASAAAFFRRRPRERNLFGRAELPRLAGLPGRFADFPGGLLFRSGRLPLRFRCRFRRLPLDDRRVWSRLPRLRFDDRRGRSLLPHLRRGRRGNGWRRRFRRGVFHRAQARRRPDLLPGRERPDELHLECALLRRTPVLVEHQPERPEDHQAVDENDLHADRAAQFPGGQRPGLSRPQRWGDSQFSHLFSLRLCDE